MWHCECERSIHVQQPCGLCLEREVLKAKTFLSRPRPRPEVPRPCHPRPRPWPSWGVLEDPQGQGQASRTTKLILLCLQRMLIILHFTGARLGFICCFQVTFVEKYFPPVSNENVKQWQKMVMYKLYLCIL